MVKKPDLSAALQKASGKIVEVPASEPREERGSYAQTFTLDQTA